ncbi:chemotaxis protein CheW, partial [Siccirubricoccus sp. KC 17139]
WLPALLARERAAVQAAEAAGRRLVALRYCPAPDCFFLGDDPLGLVRQVPGLVALHLAPREPWPAAGPEPFVCNLVIELLAAAPPEALRHIFRFVADQVELAPVPAAAAAPAPPAESAARGLRVEPARIDGLLALTGEVIVTRNRLAYLIANAEGLEPALTRAMGEHLAGLGRLAANLHATAMDLRMVPLARSFRRFPRLVRETATALGKEVTLAMEGEALRADRVVVDGLFEPLLHALRNAVDHGIEAPAARRRAGKPEAGRVALAARREAEGLVIEVTDDGAGIDTAQLREAAKRRQILPPEAVDAMDEAAATELLFLPGLSTAVSVTAVSGRGIGMDAVRQAVQALGGRLALHSAPGRGTTLQLTLPQRAAVTGLFTVRLGEELLGVPTEAVREILRLPPARILPVPGGEAFVLRDRTVPLLRLAARLGLPARPRAAGGVPVLIVGSGDGCVGLEVDAVTGQLEVLLRPLQGMLAGLPAMLGTALLGDGRLLIVIDIAELIE